MITNIAVDTRPIGQVIVEQITENTVQLVAAGPQGPPGIQQVLVDTSVPQTIYVGRAQQGISQAQSAWTITRSTFSAAGVRLSKGTATGVSWSGRTSHTYS